MSLSVPICLFLLVLVGHGAITEAVIDCSNEHFHSSIVGMKAFLKYQAYLYNFGWDFEQSITNDFFDGFKVITKLVEYVSLYHSTTNIFEAAPINETDANMINESQYVSLFESLVYDIVLNSCEWMKSYGLTFSLREVNCTNPSEIALLVSYIGSYNDAIRLFEVVSQNSCSVLVDNEIEHYLNSTLPAKNMAAKIDLKSRYDNFIANLY